LFTYKLRTKFYEQNLLGSKKEKFLTFPQIYHTIYNFNTVKFLRQFEKFYIDHYLYYELYLAGRSKSKTTWMFLYRQSNVICNRNLSSNFGDELFILTDK